MITAAELKAAVNPIDVFRRYVELRKSGARYVACCLFHDDRNPSMSIEPDGRWYCHSCGFGGDVLTFLEKAEGCTFRGAMAKLGEMAGIEITSADLPDAGLKIKLAGAELRAFDTWLTLKKRRLQVRWLALDDEEKAILTYLESLWHSEDPPKEFVERAHVRLNQIHEGKQVLDENLRQIDFKPSSLAESFLRKLYGDAECREEVMA